MKKIVAVSCAIVMVATLFIGGGQPGAIGLFPSPWDKLAHTLFFFLIVMLLRLGLDLPLWFLAGITAALGAADEIHQLNLPGRSAGFDDWLADVVGVLCAVMILKLFRCFDPTKQT